MKFNTRSVIEHERFARQHGPHHVVQSGAAGIINSWRLLLFGGLEGLY
jgi:hypothetical protein